MVLLLFYLLMALTVSFLCSVMEASLLSVPMSFVESRVIEGKKWASRLKKMKDSMDRPLAAILSLNTIAHTIGAAGVGAQATAIFGEEYFGWVSAILTVLILLLSEILPKTIGTKYCRELSAMTVYVTTGMIYLMYPIVVVTDYMTRLVSRKDGSFQEVSREDITALSSLGTEKGVFEESENKIIHNLMKLKSNKVRMIMTPRTVMVTADETTTLGEFYADRNNLTHSRIPVYDEDYDNVTGYVLKTDLLDKLAGGEKEIRLKELRRPVLFCFESTPIPSVFDTLLANKEQIAVVVDEYGGVEGVVTVEDIVETLLGLEIVDEKDDSADMQQMAKDIWKKKAKKLNIDVPE